MVEPTETETKETLDGFAEALAELLRRGRPRTPRSRCTRRTRRRCGGSTRSARPSIRSSAKRFDARARALAGRAGFHVAWLAMRIFSGIQPTGTKHLGNYIGAIRQYVQGQDRGEAIYCIVDMHAITVAYDPAELRRSTYDLTALLLAAGLDPARCILFRQGDVPEHTELCWLLSGVTELGRLQRMHQFRDKSLAQRELVSAGLLLYPVLQAADVLAYRAEEVPVGEDQREHLELMRDVARRFNARFCDGKEVLRRARASHP